MSYYKEAAKAARWIDGQMKQVLEGNQLNISETILKGTAMFEIGEQVIRKRIDHWKNAVPRIKELENDLYYELEEGP